MERKQTHRIDPSCTYATRLAVHTLNATPSWKRFAEGQGYERLEIDVGKTGMVSMDITEGDDKSNKRVMVSLDPAAAKLLYTVLHSVFGNEQENPTAFSVLGFNGHGRQVWASYAPTFEAAKADAATVPSAIPVVQVRNNRTMACSTVRGLVKAEDVDTELAARKLSDQP